MSTPRRPLIVGNWKMHGTLAESVVLTRAIQAKLVAFSSSDYAACADIVIAPPFTALALVAEQLNLIKVSDVHLPPRSNANKEIERTDTAPLRLELGAQTMNDRDRGAHTGEVSPTMLRELGVRWVILGHSERRADNGETDAAVNRKVRSALDHGFTPIVAVGETRADREAGHTVTKVTGQTRAALDGLSLEDLERCVVAYEPIWAIGTGLSEAPEDANRTIGAIRCCVEGLERTRLLYGGSVKTDNAAAIFAQPEIDGGLIGGASLHAADFIEIVRAAESAGKVYERS